MFDYYEQRRELPLPVYHKSANKSALYQELVQEFLYTHSDVLTPVEIARKNEIEKHFMDFKLNILAAK